MRAAMAAWLLAAGIGGGAAAGDAAPPQERGDVAARLRGELAAAEARLRAYPDSAEPHLDRLRLAYALGVAQEPYLGTAASEADWLAAHAGGPKA